MRLVSGHFVQVQQEGEMSVSLSCFRCKCGFTLPDALYHSAKASEKISFYCPYGHEQHYPKGETEEDKLRRERDLLYQRVAQRDDEIKSLEARRRAAVGQVTKIKNRVGHGVCPCCNRTFENLARHMSSKHPTFTAEAAE